MRMLSPLVGLTLFALAGTASAQETAPAADKPSAPPATPSAAAAPSAAAPEAVAAAAPEPVPQTVHRKIQVGLNFLPMAMGKYTYWDSFTSTATSEAYFAYGLGLSAGYEVLPGLVVGIAPQAIYNVQPKPIEGLATKAAQERDFLARVAYEYRPIDGIAVYAELLPGYSQLIPSDDTGTAAGFVLAFGAGCAVDMTDRFFLSLGGGYQVGFQSQEKEAHKLELRTKYVRVAMGGGVRF